MVRRPSRGRQRIEICRIENKERRHVTFTKRRGGLFKKAAELAVLCGAQVAAAAISEGGKVYAIGNPSFDHVISRFAPFPGDEGRAAAAVPDDDDDIVDREAVAALSRQVEETKAVVAAEQARMNAIGDKVLQNVAKAGGELWWEADVEELGVEELPEFARALQELRGNVQRKAEQLSALPPLPQQQQ